MGTQACYVDNLVLEASNVSTLWFRNRWTALEFFVLYIEGLFLVMLFFFAAVLLYESVTVCFAPWMMGVGINIWFPSIKIPFCGAAKASDYIYDFISRTSFIQKLNCIPTWNARLSSIRWKPWQVKITNPQAVSIQKCFDPSFQVLELIDFQLGFLR